MVFKLFSLVIALLMLVAPVFAQMNDFQIATADAKRDAKNDVSMLAWGAGGFVCSCLAPIYAYFNKPVAPAHRFIGKSSTYVDTYTLVYRQNVKRRRIQASVIGCGAASLLGTLMQPMLLNALEPYQTY